MSVWGGEFLGLASPSEIIAMETNLVQLVQVTAGGAVDPVLWILAFIAGELLALGVFAAIKP